MAAARANACLAGYSPRSSARRTLPLDVFGRSSANSTMRGYL